MLKNNSYADISLKTPRSLPRFNLFAIVYCCQRIIWFFIVTIWRALLNEKKTVAYFLARIGIKFSTKLKVDRKNGFCRYGLSNYSIQNLDQMFYYQIRGLLLACTIIKIFQNIERLWWKVEFAIFIAGTNRYWLLSLWNLKFD